MLPTGVQNSTEQRLPVDSVSTHGMCVSLDNFVTEEEQREQELGLHFPEREKKTCYVLLCQVKLSDIMEFLPLQLGFPKMCGKSTE